MKTSKDGSKLWAPPTWAKINVCFALYGHVWRIVSELYLNARVSTAPYVRAVDIKNEEPSLSCEMGSFSKTLWKQLSIRTFTPNELARALHVVRT